MISNPSTSNNPEARTCLNLLDTQQMELRFPPRTFLSLSKARTPASSQNLPFSTRETEPMKPSKQCIQHLLVRPFGPCFPVPFVLLLRTSLAPVPCTHFWKQCAQLTAPTADAPDAPAEKFIFSKNRAACQGCERGRQSSPLMIRLLPPQARDPEGGGRAGGPGL